jgi:hypothetical protein
MNFIVVLFVLYMDKTADLTVSPIMHDQFACDRLAAEVIEDIKSSQPEGLEMAVAKCMPLDSDQGDSDQGA